MEAISTLFWPTVAVLLTLAIYTFLWEDNPIYKVAEHIFTGVSVGYMIAQSWHNIIMPKLIVPTTNYFSNGRYLLAIYFIIGGLIGLLYLSRFSEKTSWLSRYPIAITVGFYAGFKIVPIWMTNVSKQLNATIQYPNGDSMLNLKMFGKFFDNPTWGNFISAINGPIIVIGVLLVLIYFFFSFSNDNIVVRASRKPALVVLMLGFGGSFGYTFMARISLFIGRMNYIFSDWIEILTTTLGG
ncbi:MAG: hypothetical protein FXF47_09170 [Candidatus Mcinerneyibacterium aminivorans]|jgi:hypothetical protein|uniref:Uncharacterized protein n=1 Tax=Candidatus Mcinerneyibacterium aminivorans TaxID=2703815 RepID=A0A5D0MDM4_9BACT|nr:MAG: hypothetical protein FXF47_09170 [Candidatus Mcinerneyibacterium aminivorans]